jgi:hypothetical protein
MNLLSTTASILLLLGCTHADASGASQASRSHKAVTLTAERAAAANEAFRLQVFAGPLQPGHRLVVRLPNGEIVGTIAPYGTASREKGGSSVMALPANALQNGKVTVHLEVIEKRGAAPRAPTAHELEKVVLLIVPVAKR